MLKSYWLSLQLIAHDVSLLFRNFFHWNLSKLAIFVVTVGMSAIASLPLLGLGWWMVSDTVNGLGAESISDLLTSGILPESVLTSLVSNYWLLGGLALIVILVFSIFTVFMTYGYYLTSRVYQSYLDGGKLSVLDNDYWSVKHIWKFCGILSWSSLYLLAPITVGLVGLGALMFLTTGSGLITSSTVIGIILTVFGVAVLAYFTYVAVRVMFAYMNMLNPGAFDMTALDLVKQSIRLASGKIWKIVFLVAPFAIAIAIVGVGIQSAKEARDINVLASKAKAAAVANPNEFINDHAFIQRDFILGYRLDAAQKQDVIAINNAYDVRTDGADPEFLKAIYPYVVASGTMNEPMDIAWQIGITLLSFFVIEGVMIMVYLSIFHILRHEEKPKERIVKTSKPVVIEETPTIEKKVVAKKSAPTKKPTTTEKKPAEKKKTTAAKKPAAKKSA